MSITERNEIIKTVKRHRLSSEEMRRRDSLKHFIIQEWRIDEPVAKAFAKKHLHLDRKTISHSINEVASFFGKAHTGHYGSSIDQDVLARAMNHTLKRFARCKSLLTEKQLNYFLQLARDEIAIQVTTWSDPGNAQEREKVLTPLKQALFYEDDEAMKKRLLFIYMLFVKKGMKLGKQKIIHACTNDQLLFPHRRVVEDALETLRGAYEALGFLEGDLFITPDYISV